jgi:hypothetical protein
MKSKVVVEGRERTFVLVLDPAEEAFRSISKFADPENISGASVPRSAPSNTPRLAGLISKPALQAASRR